MGAEKLQTRRGRLIAIEGIDQSGKRTQAIRLVQELRRVGYSASLWNFPDYSTPLGGELRAYLAGRSRLNYRAVHLLYAANKWERVMELTHELSRGRNIIVNRYSPSNLAYGVAHSLPLEWLKTLENGLPKPNAVFVLDITPRTSFGRKTKPRDVHEADRKYLSIVRSAYLRLAREYGWKVIDGERDPRIVQAELWASVSRLMRVKSKVRSANVLHLHGV
jgi:dTMP kinase